jgi:hypothetical protein
MRRNWVFGTLDNEPVNDYGGSVELGSELAVSYSQHSMNSVGSSRGRTVTARSQ